MINNTLRLKNNLTIEPQDIVDYTDNITGLKLGIGNFLVPEPINPMGAVNVSFADRTYAKKEEISALRDAISLQFNLITESVQEIVDSNLSSLPNLSAQISDLQIKYRTYNNLVNDIIYVELESIKNRLAILEQDQ